MVLGFKSTTFCFLEAPEIFYMDECIVLCRKVVSYIISNDIF